MRRIVILFLIAVLLLGAVGCAAINRNPRFAYTPNESGWDKPSLSLKVAVLPFSDERPHYFTGFFGDAHYLVPLIPYAKGRLSRMEKAEWVTHWGMPKGVSFCREVPLAIAKDLNHAGIFADVQYVDDENLVGSYDLILRGILKDTDYAWSITAYGLSLPGGLLPLVGLPHVRVHTNMRTDVRLVSVFDGQEIWNYHLEERNSQIVGVYTDMWNIPNVDSYFAMHTHLLRKGMAKAIASLQSETIVASLSAFAKVAGRAKRPSPPPSIRNVHVLIVGVGNYTQTDVKPLKHSASGARAMYDFFASSPRSLCRPENVHLVTDIPNKDNIKADRAGILLAMRKYLAERANHKNDMAILYFIGHGEVATDPRQGTTYCLLPQDARKDALRETAITLKAFQDAWNGIEAQTKVVLADACHAGLTTGIQNLKIRGVEHVSGSTAVFSACAANEVSIQSDKLLKGVFTQAVLDGLSGKADIVAGNDDQRVTLGELKRYLKQRVPILAREESAKQTPVINVPGGWGDVYLTR